MAARERASQFEGITLERYAQYYLGRTGVLLLRQSVNSLAGHFRSNIVAHPRVCFEISEMGTVFPYGEFECDSSVSYRSVVGFGAISIERGKREKVEFFDLLMSKYSSPSGRPKSFYPRIGQVTVYSLSIETVTGKYQVLPAANEIWPAANKTKTPGAKPPAS